MSNRDSVTGMTGTWIEDAQRLQAALRDLPYAGLSPDMPSVSPTAPRVVEIAAFLEAYRAVVARHALVASELEAKYLQLAADVGAMRRLLGTDPRPEHSTLPTGEPEVRP
jgi:hypothetical protein